MVQLGFKPDLDDQLVSFSALTLFWPVKIVPEMTYNVLSWTLSLYTATTTQLIQCANCWCGLSVWCMHSSFGCTYKV